MTDVTLTLLAPAEPQAALIAKNAVAAGLAIIADDLRAPALMRAPTLPLVGIPAGPPGPAGAPGETATIEIEVQMLAPYSEPTVTKVGPPSNPVFTLGIPPTPPARHIETLDASKTEWVVNHGLDHYPNVQVVDSAGDVILVNIEHVDSNIAILRYNTPMTGRAFFA